VLLLDVDGEVPVQPTVVLVVALLALSFVRTRWCAMGWRTHLLLVPVVAGSLSIQCPGDGLELADGSVEVNLELEVCIPLVWIILGPWTGRP
jgi:hypothetical protein